MTAALEGAEWSAARPSRTIPQGKTRYPYDRRLGGPVWTGVKSRPHRDSIPNRPGRSQSLYQLSYPDHKKNIYIYIYAVWRICVYAQGSSTLRESFVQFINSQYFQ